MHGMEQGMDGDVEAKLQVLQEIKDLMDSRLGDSMNPQSASMEVPPEEAMEEGVDPVDGGISDEMPPEAGMEAMPPEGGAPGEVGMDDKNKLMEMLRSKLG